MSERQGAGEQDPNSVLPLNLLQDSLLFLSLTFCICNVGRIVHLMALRELMNEKLCT